MWLLLALPVLWLAVILAQSWEPGIKLAGLLDALTVSFENPFALRWTERTAAFSMAAVLLYAAAVGYYYSTTSRSRAGEEHGSAQWGKPRQLNAKYANYKDPLDNVILIQNVRIGMDTHKHRRNLNTLVVGGSGSGKTRHFAMPSGLMQVNCSYLCTDPKGGATRS